MTIMMMRCDIIIPIWNELEDTRECIESIFRHTPYPYRLILVDNASAAPTAEYLNSLKYREEAEVIILRNSANLGFVKAVNQALRVSDSPYICVMNNDTIATSGWLEEIIDVMEKNPDIGLANPSSNTSGQFPRRDQSIDDYSLSLKSQRHDTQELYTCRGFCMVMKRAVFDTLGFFDEIYKMGYFEETEYSIKAQGAAFKIARVKSSYVYHKENVTFRKLGGVDELFRVNERIFTERWGRAVRVGYLVDRADNYNKVDEIASNVARAGHQIVVFLKKGLPWPVSIDHFGIRRVDINSRLFLPLAIYKILKYRRKKKIEVILADNGASALKLMSGILGAETIVNPRADDILKYLRSISK